MENIRLFILDNYVLFLIILCITSLLSMLYFLDNDIDETEETKGNALYLSRFYLFLSFSLLITLMCDSSVFSNFSSRYESNREVLRMNKNSTASVFTYELKLKIGVKDVEGKPVYVYAPKERIIECKIKNEEISKVKLLLKACK